MAEALVVSFRRLLNHMDIAEVVQMPLINTPSSVGSSQS